jgi:hypothetical protein
VCDHNAVSPYRLVDKRLKNCPFLPVAWSTRRNFFQRSRKFNQVISPFQLTKLLCCLVSIIMDVRLGCPSLKKMEVQCVIFTLDCDYII